MSDITATIDTYLEAYGEADAARRIELIEQVWAADGQLVDPPLDAAGHDAISNMAAAVQGQFPGHRFRRSTDVDAHHGFARYGWELVASDGTVAVSGVDIAELDDARLQRVIGFFGDLPPKGA
jgi:SnoaL-like domain